MITGKRWNLHTVGSRADWKLVAKEEQNAWQRLASATKGVITPANITSVAGAALVGLGLWYLYSDYLLWGFVLISVGRLADILDGIVAQATGTKSSVGEALDATVDKITVIAALIVFVAAGIMPMLAVALVAARNSANITLSLLARVHHRTLHPSRVGKLASGLEWIAIVLFIIAALFANHGWAAAETTALAAGYLVLAVTLILGVVAIRTYSTQSRGKVKNHG